MRPFFFLVNASYIALIWELIDRTPGDEIPPTLRRVMRVRTHDVMPLRGGNGGSIEISARGTRHVYLLPDRLPEARSAGSGRAANLARRFCVQRFPRLTMVQEPATVFQPDCFAAKAAVSDARMKPAGPSLSRVYQKC
jgi:hypothetical protein